MSVLFVSDVHLDRASPDAVIQFLEFLASHAAQAAALYILGDLFETWVGDDDSEAAEHAGARGNRPTTAGAGLKGCARSARTRATPGPW